MKFGLKGITKADVILGVLNHGVQEFSFDLRPRSFNFTQAYNIVSILETCSDQPINYQLMFENEKNFMIKSVIEQIENGMGEKRIFHLEFTGVEDITEIDNLGNPYTLHFQEGIKISELEKTKNLKRVVFKHKDLQAYSERGELTGFLLLFSDLKEKVDFEIQLDWDTDLLYSVLDFFPFKTLSFEVNNLVETSYQNVNMAKVTEYIDFLHGDLKL